MWFDRKLRGNVHLEKMVNEAEECVGKGDVDVLQSECIGGS